MKPIYFRDQRRLNVAITRAKKQLTVICDSETVGSDRLLGQFLQYLKGSKARAFIRRPEAGDVNWHLLKDKYIGSPSKLSLACSQAALEKGMCRLKMVGEYN